MWLRSNWSLLRNFYGGWIEENGVWRLIYLKLVRRTSNLLFIVVLWLVASCLSSHLFCYWDGMDWTCKRSRQRGFEFEDKFSPTREEWCIPIYKQTSLNKTDLSCDSNIGWRQSWWCWKVYSTGYKLYFMKVLQFQRLIGQNYPSIEI